MNLRSFCFLVISIGFTTINCALPPIGIRDYYPHERDALIQVRESLTSPLISLHSKWTGPPCYKDASNWIGVACLDGHVIHLSLEGAGLRGSLPYSSLQNLTSLTKISFRNNSLFGPLPNLSGLLHLHFIFLSHNRFSGLIPLDYINLPELNWLELQENLLTGNIPPFNQPSLTVFNVSYNYLGGLIPETPTLQRFNESSYRNNTELCGKPLNKPCTIAPPPPPSSPVVPSKEVKHKSLKLWMIVLIAVAGALAPFILLIVCLCYCRKMHEEGTTSKQGSAEPEKIMQSSGSVGDPERRVALEFFDKERPTFDLEDLLRASAEILGKGKLGSTYKVTIETGLVVAVKRVKEMNGLNKKDFLQQMQLLGKMKHENLVEIISFYYSKEEKLIIYEYVSNGSLYDLLHGVSENRGAGRMPLNWRRRFSIVKGLARGLAYLHESLPTHKVPHANIRSSNILIDQSDHVKLTDFGFLPLLPSPKALGEKLCVGMCPEFSQGKKLTHKADVYCFGMLLLEIITGRIAWASDDDLSEWVRSNVDGDWSIDILDLEIAGAKEEHDEMFKLIELALECTSTAPERRPKMSQVLTKLEKIEQQQTEVNPER